MALVAAAPCFTPGAHAMMSATKPKSIESGLSIDTVIRHQIFLEEFRELAQSCNYDPYFDYESEETEIRGCPKLNHLTQAIKLPKKSRRRIHKKIAKHFQE